MPNRGSIFWKCKITQIYQKKRQLVRKIFFHIQKTPAVSLQRVLKIYRMSLLNSHATDAESVRLRCNDDFLALADCTLNSRTI